MEYLDDRLIFKFRRFKTDSPIYMWSTEMKDKRRKEVYHSDIVCVNRGDSFTSFNTGIVQFSSGAYYFVPFKYHKKSLPELKIVHLFDWEIKKVLGNIYEHKDLLRSLIRDI